MHKQLSPDLVGQARGGMYGRYEGSHREVMTVSLWWGNGSCQWGLEEVT